MLKNVITSGGEDKSDDEFEPVFNAKIQNALNNLNIKMSQLNEQRKAIEDEIRREVHASSASLLSGRGELSDSDESDFNEVNTI